MAEASIQVQGNLLLSGLFGHFRQFMVSAYGNVLCGSLFVKLATAVLALDQLRLIQRIEHYLFFALIHLLALAESDGGSESLRFKLPLWQAIRVNLLLG